MPPKFLKASKKRKRETYSMFISDDLVKAFLTTKVKDHQARKKKEDSEAKRVGKGKSVCVLKGSNTLPEALKLMSEEGFLSVPVVSRFSPDGKKRYTGFIDMVQLVDFVAHLFWGESPEEWTEFMQYEARFQTTTIADIMRKPRAGKRRDPTPPIDAECTTFAALEMMGKGDIPHMAVVDNEKHVVGILTRSMLISWLSQMDPAELGELGTMKVCDMRKSSVVTVVDTEAAINAFYRMIDYKVDGVAVVDEDGTLRGAVSARDLRGVGTSGAFFSRLFKDIPTFKRLMKLDYPTLVPGDEAAKGTPRRGIYVVPTQRFCDVLRYMQDGNIHRVFVCSENSHVSGYPRPTHVITQQDMLWHVAQYISTLNQPKAAMYTPSQLEIGILDGLP